MTHVERVAVTNSQVVTHRLDAAVWGLFFLWVGLALVTDIGWGVGLIGVGGITLAGQLARKYFSLPVEGFWVAVGLTFALGGVWEMMGLQFGLVPVLLIVAGLALLFAAVRG